MILTIEGDERMLSKKLIDALNAQMNEEFEAAHAYMAMASYCEFNNYSGFAHFFFEQAEEERFHGMKFYNYINDRGAQAIFSSLPAPVTEFESILHTFESALAQEKVVTKSIYNLTDIATEEKEHATISFLNWFLDEQVEEEATFDTHIEYIKRLGTDKNALFLYERELGQRSFDPNAEE